MSKSRLAVFINCLACMLILSTLELHARQSTNDSTSSGASSTGAGKDSTILVYSQENTSFIEAAIIGDILTLKKKDGTTEKLSMSALNRKGKSDVATMWNLYCFYIVKDVWRGLTHEEKLMGQASVTIDVSKDGKYKIIRHGLYVPGCPPCLNDSPVPAKAQEFWKQAQRSIQYVEFDDMKIPGKDNESVKVDVIFGRDLQVFPRYEFCNFKGTLLRDNWGKIKRGKTSPPSR